MNDLKTQLLQADKNGIEKAGQLLKQGEVVGIPTETVYGLAASSLDGRAVKKIFEAKGRPQDNPLISHISDLSMLELVVRDIPQSAYQFTGSG